MKKTSIFAIIVIVLVAIAAFFIGRYNGMITMGEKVDAKFADIDTQLQRRMDLIPNLVGSVQGYMAHEQDAIAKVTDARTKLMNASTIAEKGEADNQLTGALNNLLALVENYPDLKASQNFINLQDELAGTENRIATARKDYNEAVKNYNTKISTIPTSIIANMMGKEKKDFFEVSDQSKLEVPEVNFNNSTNNGSKTDSDK